MKQVRVCRGARVKHFHQDVLLYGDGTPYSIDSRYFGVTDRHAIQSVLRPVLTY